MMTTDKVAYVLGLDLGQASDYSALTVLERHAVPERRVVQDLRRPSPLHNHYAVRHLERFQLGTSYVAIIARVKQIVTMTEPRGKPRWLEGSILGVDQTGVGRAVVDMLRQASLPVQLHPVTITGGHQVSQEGDGYHVPKKELIGVVQVLLQSRRLTIARSLKEAAVLERELADFRVKVTVAANETFGPWREGQHDDSLLATAIACWLGERLDFSEETFTPYVLADTPLARPAPFHG